jgi:hypothetical protein
MGYTTLKRSVGALIDMYFTHPRCNGGALYDTKFDSAELLYSTIRQPPPPALAPGSKHNTSLQTILPEHHTTWNPAPPTTTTYTPYAKPFQPSIVYPTPNSSMPSTRVSQSICPLSKLSTLTSQPTSTASPKQPGFCRLPNMFKDEQSD